jgi:hypothetical protein
MSDKIMKTGTGWKLEISKIPKTNSKTTYREAILTLNGAENGNSLVGVYSFRFLNESVNDVLGTVSWSLNEVQNFHADYQRRLNSKGGSHIYDEDGFSGSLNTLGVQIDFRLPTWDEYKSYWGVIPNRPLSGIEFGGCDIVFATIKTKQISLTALINLFYLKHWGENHFNVLRNDKNGADIQDFVLAYKIVMKQWVKGNTVFSEKIDVDRLIV